MIRLILLSFLTALAVFGQGFPGNLTQETFVVAVGPQVSGSNIFLHPYGIKVRGNEVWVADTGGDAIQVHDKSTGTRLRTITYGTTPGPSGTSHPYQLDFDVSGNVYVMDNNSGSCRIYKLDPTTGVEITHWGSCGTGDGQFTTGVWIRGLVVYNSEVYVADASQNRVQVFDLSGNFVRKFSTFGPPTKSAYQLAIYNNEIYIAEGLYVQVYDLNGTFARTLSIKGQAIPLDEKLGIINGELYVSCAADSLIHILDPVTGVEKRRPLGVYANNYCINSIQAAPDALCLGPGQFNNPGEVFVDGGFLYVADINNYRYQKFSYPW